MKNNKRQQMNAQLQAKTGDEFHGLFVSSFGGCVSFLRIT